MSATLPPALKRARLALQQHRRQFGRQRIPDTIRQQVVDLLVSCPRKQVVNTLGISYKMLCCWEQEQVASEADSMRFVPLPLAAEPAPDQSGPLPAIEWRFSDDGVLAFYGEHATMQCLALLQGLGYGRDAAPVAQVVSA